MGNCFSKTSGMKKKIWDIKDAQGLAQSMTQKYKQKFEVYFCKYCGAYHLGRINEEDL